MRREFGKNQNLLVKHSTQTGKNPWAERGSMNVVKGIILRKNFNTEAEHAVKKSFCVVKDIQKKHPVI